MAAVGDRARPPAASARRYDPGTVELEWQRRWAEAEAFRTPLPDQRPSTYVFAGCPFTTGGAHMGHIRSYTISDSFVRFRRARGDAVLFSLGFDSFGLPAELEAIKRGLSPQAWVRQCGERMRAQFERLGYSCDWGRSFVSSEPVHYRWSQWLFLALLERGLVYRREAQVIWCDSCETVLAALQSEGDVCWRCGGETRFRRLPQWFLKISAFVRENEEGLAGLSGWNRAAIGSQKAILGRSDGYEVEAEVLGHGPLTVFMTGPEAITGADAVAVSPNHPEIDLFTADAEVATGLERLRQGGRRRSHRAIHELVPTGLEVRVPGRGEPLPLVIASDVDNRLGPTAVLDEQGAGAGASSSPPPKLRPAVRYRAQDFPISRQRSWGAPIPLVHCKQCGTVPVPPEQLPVELPEDLPRTGAGNALARCESFVSCSCPRCGEAAARETDTLDCHVDALWMWLPICVPAEDRTTTMFDHPEVRRWMPVRQIVWGADAGGYLFDQRATAKFLQDVAQLPPLPAREPFVDALMHQMIQMEGRKMSKHLGNVVDPLQLVATAGADAVRLAVLAAAAPAKSFDWDERPLVSARAFLDELWRYAEPRLWGWPAEEGHSPGSDRLRGLLAKWSRVGLKKTTESYQRLEMQRAVRNITLLFEHIQEFERRALERRGALEDADREAIGVALRTLVLILAPAAPHIAEELWAAAGNRTMACATPWPVTPGD